MAQKPCPMCHEAKSFTWSSIAHLSVGGLITKTLPEEEKRLKLVEYQEEKRLFTEFLKREFFAQPLSPESPERGALAE